MQRTLANEHTGDDAPADANLKTISFSARLNLQIKLCMVMQEAPAQAFEVSSSHTSGGAAPDRTQGKKGNPTRLSRSTLGFSTIGSRTKGSSQAER